MQTRGIRPCLIHFQKKIIIIIISKKKKKKKIKISKNHASISKLRAFGHASSILKKEEIIFSSNIKVFISHASICKLGAYGHASFIFKKEDHHHHLSKKINNQDFQKSCTISKLGVFGHASSILKKKEIIFSSKVKVFKIVLQFVD